MCFDVLHCADKHSVFNKILKLSLPPLKYSDKYCNHIEQDRKHASIDFEILFT